jgi:glutamate-5-semialdehyde dehydrogenase
MVEVPVKIYVTNLAKKARETARPLSLLSGAAKAKALAALADRLDAQAEAVLEANRQDVEAVGKTLEGQTNKDTVKEAVDRVRLTADDLRKLTATLRQIAELPDPVGEITKVWRRPNGMQVSRMRVPIGVIGIISEQGPVQTTEAAALCLKAGNVCLLRTGPEWTRTNALIAAAVRQAAQEAGIPPDGMIALDRPEREVAAELLRQTKYLDAVIPLGGPGLNKTIAEQTRLPLLCHETGVCHVYIDGDADLPLAQNIVVNSKVQRAAATNAVDTLLVHQSTSRPLLPGLIRRLLDEFKVEVRGCPKTVALTGAQSLTGYKSVVEAKDEDWGRQFQAPILAIKIVKDLDEALEHIGRYGPGHTDTIVTRDYATAMRFAREVDSGAVLVNASTRLHDGEEFGLGGSVGVNTHRPAARGPVALESLTCEKYVVLGTGQLRHPHPVPVAYEDAIMLKRPS